MAQSAEAPAAMTVSNDTPKIVDTTTILGSQLSLPKVNQDWNLFDRTSNNFSKQWVDQVQNIHLQSKGNQEATLLVGSRLLKGSALDYFFSIAPGLTSWDQFEQLMTEHDS